MTEAKPAATRKPRAKTVVQDVEQVVEEVKAEAEKLVAEAEAEAPVVEAEVEAEVLKVEEVLKEVEGEFVNLTDAELRQLHDDAIAAEAALKVQLYMLRQRAANLATTAEADVEHEIIALKAEVAKAETWLKKVEAALGGKLKDIWGTVFE